VQTQSKVLATPPADPQVAHQHFCCKLATETDSSDVYTDLQNGVNDFVLVDVRSPEAYARSHAINAINIPHALITAERMAEFPPESIFVVYCWGPGCNGADKAAARLSALGRPVKIMIGGIEYWETHEQNPVERA
jgi:rhodanese-related sulfurtransferase